MNQLSLTFHAVLCQFSRPVWDFSRGTVYICHMALYPRDADAPETDTLYLSRGSDLPQNGHGCFLCPDCTLSEMLLSRHQIAMVSDCRDFEELCSLALEAYGRLAEWLLSLQRSVLDGAGVQDLLDLSETVLKNCVTVLDSSLKLLAFSKTSPPEDEANRFLLEHGYHSAETLEKFRKYGRFQEPADLNSVVISDDRVISDYGFFRRSRL